DLRSGARLAESVHERRAVLVQGTARVLAAVPGLAREQQEPDVVTFEDEVGQDALGPAARRRLQVSRESVRGLAGHVRRPPAPNLVRFGYMRSSATGRSGTRVSALKTG